LAKITPAPKTNVRVHWNDETAWTACTTSRTRIVFLVASHVSSCRPTFGGTPCSIPFSKVGLPFSVRTKTKKYAIPVDTISNNFYFKLLFIADGCANQKKGSVPRTSIRAGHAESFITVSNWKATINHCIRKNRTFCPTFRFQSLCFTRAMRTILSRGFDAGIFCPTHAKHSRVIQTFPTFGVPIDLAVR